MVEEKDFQILRNDMANEAKDVVTDAESLGESMVVLRDVVRLAKNQQDVKPAEAMDGAWAVGQNDEKMMEEATYVAKMC